MKVKSVWPERDPAKFNFHPLVQGLQEDYVRLISEHALELEHAALQSWSPGSFGDFAGVGLHGSRDYGGRSETAAEKKLRAGSYVTASLNAEGFPIVLGEYLSFFSQLAYDELPDTSRQPSATGFFGAGTHKPTTAIEWLTDRCHVKNAQRFSLDSWEFYCFIHERHAFVVFRGSDAELADWKRNLDVRSDDNMGVHRGFADAASSIDCFIDYWIDRNDRDFDGFVLAGHSQGGALATVCAYSLAMRGHVVRAVVTYGAPRIGGKKFAAAYEELLGPVSWRVCHDHDPVCNLPPEAMGFRHVGKPFLLPQHLPMPDDPRPILHRAAQTIDEWMPLVEQALLQAPWYLPLLTEQVPSAIRFGSKLIDHKMAYGYGWEFLALVRTRFRDLFGDDGNALHRYHCLYLYGTNPHDQYPELRPSRDTRWMM